MPAHDVSLLLRSLAWGTSAAWIYKAVSAARGLRAIPNLLLAPFDRQPDGNPTICVIVPACNEQLSVAACLSSLVNQDYGQLHVIAVDDRSTDETGSILELLAGQHQRLTALHVDALPPKWLGKTHAMALAARHAISLHNPDWLLFTDADVIFHREAVRRSLAQAVSVKADHFVTIPTALVLSLGEGAVLGFLQVIGLWATRLWRVHDPQARDSMGIGAFNLIRKPAYLQIGGFEAIPLAIVEDLTLARRIKKEGLSQQVAFAHGYVKIHWASGAIGVVNTMTKNLFAIFRFNVGALLFSCVGLALFCIFPFVALWLRETRAPAVLALCAILSLYVTSQRHSGIEPWNFAAFPIGAVLFIYSLLRSMIVTLRRGGVEWRGTFYSLSELRESLPPI